MNNREGKLSNFLLGMGIGVFLNYIYVKYRKKDKKNSFNPSIKKYEMGFQVFNKWVKLKNESKTFEPYFQDNEISIVAIYGMGDLGERLYEELNNLNVGIAYAIDRMASAKKINGLRVVGIDDTLENVDAIIVTPIQDYYEIEKMLEEKTDIDIISLEYIVDYCI